MTKIIFPQRSEYVLAEKTIFLELMNSLDLLCVSGSQMRVNIRSELGMTKSTQAECEMCLKTDKWCTSSGGGKEQNKCITE